MAILGDVGASSLVVGHPSTVTWLTGYPPEIETGPTPFALSAIAVLGRVGTMVLVVSEDEAEAAAATGCAVVSYPGYGIGPVDPVGGAVKALSETLDGASVAIDAEAFPAALARRLDWVDVSEQLARARAVKDPDEIALMRAAIAVCDAGQAAARESAAPGMSELDLWASVRGAMEDAAGTRLPVLADLVSGLRTAEIGGAPRPRALEQGDLVLCDLVPRVAATGGLVRDLRRRRADQGRA